jgi:hypothetical protein
MADHGAFAEINLSPATKELLQSLGDWTATAEFKTAKEKSWETCSDKNREIVLKLYWSSPRSKIRYGGINSSPCYFIPLTAGRFTLAFGGTFQVGGRCFHSADAYV